MADSPVFEIGGVKYEFTPEREMTFEQSAEVALVIEDAGLADIEKVVAAAVAEAAAGEDGVDDDLPFLLARRIVLHIYRTRKQAWLLAAFVRPPGQDWTRAFAEEAATNFAMAKGEDVLFFQDRLAEIVIGFFEGGLGSSRTSRRSSVRLEPRGAAESSPENGPEPTSETSTP